MSDDPGVRIDIAHARLIEGLVCAHKPASVLEFGFGGGRSAGAILRGLDFNGQPFDYTLVDNFCDWGGNQPEEARTFFAQHPEVSLVVSDEGKFVHDCNLSCDFIMSDADHFHAHEWFKKTYHEMLNPGGVLIYHDVTQFPGLETIVQTCLSSGLRHVVFGRCSRPGEACQRGLLCIFKPQE